MGWHFLFMGTLKSPNMLTQAGKWPGYEWSGGLNMSGSCSESVFVCRYYPANLSVYTSTPSPSPQKSSPVGLNCFQGNLQSGGEGGLTARREKQDKNAENKMERLSGLTPRLRGADAMTLRLAVHCAAAQDGMCRQLLVALPLKWIKIPSVDEW